MRASRSNGAMRTKHKRWTVVRVVLILLNTMTTFITLFTGLRENLIISMATGRYDVLRHRLRSGSINTEILEPNHFRLQDLATPEQLAGYTIVTTPTRNIKSFGEDVSVCTNVNTNSAPVQLSNYDDFWGKGPRRVQTYVYSISAPNCDVLNVKPEWRAQCVTDHEGNATQCHQFVLDNFDTLRQNRHIRMLTAKDLGAAGTLFLRCSMRPLEPFTYQADRFAHQTYWDGGQYHVTLQTSSCRTIPLVQSRDMHHSLYEAFDISDGATMMVLLPHSGWFAYLVPWVHSFVTLVLLTRGIMLALFHTSFTKYLPHGVRFQGDHKWTRYLLPFMEMITRLSDNDRAIITFKGSLLVASDFWMTHWLYMWLSVLDAIVNIRSMYVTFQIAQSLLVMRITFESMIFLWLAMTKITWLMCLVQTILRILMRIFVRCLRAMRLIKSITREQLEWSIDGVFMFLSYRIYYLLFSIVMIVLLQVKGDTSFMQRAIPYKVGAYGGPIEIAGFWGSEVACDLVAIMAILTAVSLLFGMLMLCTKYRYVANNGLMRFIQQRYVLCGWDGLLTADILGLDPYDDDVVVDSHAYTQLSLGSLLQLLYLAGPSGFVHLAGDYIFHDNGFSKDPTRFAYPIPKAMDMGLFKTGKGSAASSSLPTTTVTDGGTSLKQVANTVLALPVRAKDPTSSALTVKKSIFERKLRVVSDGFFGKILFIDAKQPGQITANKETGQREYEVVDALTTMSILDIKYLMGREKKIRVQ